MYDWLLKDENYNPRSDKDSFINKSILSFLGVLAKIRNQSIYTKNIFNINAVLKAAFTFLFVLMVSITGKFTFVIIANVCLLAVLSLMNGDIIIKVLKVSLLMTAFTFVIMLPAAIRGNGFSSLMITSKVFATVTAVNILSYTTRWNLITGALKRFFVPDIFILVLDIAIKYIVMLGDFALGMLYSLKLRSVGKNKSKYISFSGIAGTMFIKSGEMAEEMYSAMECRGFTGEYRTYKRFKFTMADFLFILINVGLLIIFVYLERA